MQRKKGLMEKGGGKSFFRRKIHRIKDEVLFLKSVISDPRTPKVSRWILSLALAYVLSPLDLVPDFIPVVGQLDDLIIVPILVLLALRIVPEQVILENRKRLMETPRHTQGGEET